MNHCKKYFLTDVHNHSDFSFDGKAPLSQMLACAQEKEIAFYGITEHFDFDVCAESQKQVPQTIDEDAYFHTARHLQEDYAGVMNVLVGAEFGFSEEENVQGRYASSYEKHRPDFVVNSVHSCKGWDYYFKNPYYRGGVLREQREVMEEYFTLVQKSLHVRYPYDIVAHVGYAARYGDYAEKRIRYADYQSLLDEILKTVIEKDKILEGNGKEYQAQPSFVAELFQRYFELGGRKVSYASDAHRPLEILRERERIVHTFKQIGFTHVTVPCRGEHIQVEI